ncbi:hypothetical protein SAMN04487969_109189 [Paenibacillus algorifonticola]|uniref:Cof subfamily of IIB subfamily of haloacid dehalogenase superfamily/HAD-superfamily hydrolase, subfamily IIB n=1 Tax=Paenibacillus algorifonticola TaxID=684063 RepID=A0A1I2ELM0_9BACL|nr:Cof-type HAD-IIB family hydrolase [Paenibacillus algorifonticola]SFE93416.1 hypothetical protein SAMN04487969_109189 [Paenibacillus algorifonticola]
MYKLFAMDMDGTLLDKNKQITPGVRKALMELQESGVTLTIASGRFPASVWMHGKEIAASCPLIGLNGSVLLDPETGELLSGTPLRPEHASSVAMLTEQRDMYIHFYGYNRLYVKELTELNRSWPLANVVVKEGRPLTDLDAGYQKASELIKVIPVGRLSSFAIGAMEPLYKATVICDDSEQLEQLYAELATWGAFTLTRTGSRRFDINAAGVSKRSALAQLCAEQNIAPEQVAAIGDYDNDTDMLRWAGLGIAMGNAADHIKRIAACTTAANSENGVAQAIRDYLLTSPNP